jgi:hypothetical protein
MCVVACMRYGSQPLKMRHETKGEKGVRTLANCAGIDCRVDRGGRQVLPVWLYG